MKAMLLTAGLGTRLRPLTLERAKPAVPVCGIPLILRIVRFLNEQGVSSFKLNLSWLPQTIRSIFEKTGSSLFDVTFSHEPDILGTAGGLKDNQAFFDSGTFIMVNGDILFDFRIDQAINFHKSNGALATLLLRPQKAPFQFTPVRIDERSNIISFSDKTQEGKANPQTFIFTGIHILEPKIFDYIDSGVFYEIISQAYARALDNGEKVFGYQVGGYWNDLGNPPRYIEAVRHVLSGEMGSPPTEAWISDIATVHESAKLKNVSLEGGCQVGPGCIIKDSVIWEGSTIGKNCVIQNCIIGSGVKIVGDHFGEVITVNGTRPVEP